MRQDRECDVGQVLTDCRSKVVVYTEDEIRALDLESARRTKKDHVGSLLRDIRPRDVHCDAQVSFLEGRRVVHAISSTAPSDVNIR